MIEKEMLNWLSDKLKIQNIALIEKDLLLQGLLNELSKSEYFSENFVFKGGTCLTKAYFGYYRFSEDLDFTWISQKNFENKTEKQIRKILSQEINKIMELLAAASKELDLDFKAEKSNKHYVQLGGSNRFATFKFWYKPIDEERETFIKIQLNFVEKIVHKPTKHVLNAIATAHNKDIEFLFPNRAAMALQSPEFYCYDLKEIASEKIRALLTRRGFKARDIIDLYMIAKKDITIKSVKSMAFEKTKFMLRYLKYAEHLKHKHFDGNFSLGEEQNLLVTQPGKDFEKFAAGTIKELNELAEEFRGKLKEKD